MPAPAVSIIICTCNRADDLRLTLASIAQADIPDDLTVELIVADNASTDHTKQVAHEFTHPRIPVSYLHEPRRGKGFAYNTAMAHARGDVLLFTDDDVRVPPNWITGMSSPILNGQADAVAGGVKLAPHLERPWMFPMLREAVGETRRLNPENPEDMVGANMAFSRKVLTHVPAFDTELGPGALGFWDETLFSCQIKQAGHRLIGALDVTVEHHFQVRRLTRNDWMDNARKHGQSFAYIIYHWRHDEPGYLRLLGGWIGREIRLILWRLKHPQELKRVEGCVEDEFVYVKTLERYRYLLKCIKRNRKYNKYGLYKTMDNSQNTKVVLE